MAGAHLGSRCLRYDCFNFFRAETNNETASATNSPTPSHWLWLARGMNLSPTAKKLSDHGTCSATPSQCGTCRLNSGSCSKLIMIASSPKTPPAAINPLAYSDPGLTSLSAPPFFSAPCSASQRTSPPANIAIVVPIDM